MKMNLNKKKIQNTSFLMMLNKIYVLVDLSISWFNNDK